MSFFGGVEGGGSHSKAVIIDENCKAVSWAEGPDTNVWQIGVEEVCKRISVMIEEAKVAAGISKDCKLKSLGMCLSGGEQETQNKKMTACFKENYSHLSEHFIIKSDTFGSIATACKKGGVVLISGTGTNCQLLNPDGSTLKCGGWGHMMGDEGSAYWISHRAVKYVFDDMDGMQKAPHDIAFVKKAMFEFFKISNRNDLLDYLYTNFKKSFIGGFCKVLALEGANEAKDPLCVHIFNEAGRLLAQHVVALYSSVDESLKSQEGGLQVVCVGSVFKSWNLLKQGFVERLKESDLKRLTLVELVESSAVGSALIGVSDVGVQLPVDFEKNYKVLEKIQL